MFAVFGLGAQEVILLLLLAVLFIGVPVGIALLVLVLAHRKGHGLDAENRRA